MRRVVEAGLAAVFLAAASAPQPAAADSFDASSAVDTVGAARSLGRSIGARSRALAARASAAGQQETAPPFILPTLQGEVLVLASPEQARAIEAAEKAKPAAQQARLRILTGKVVLLYFWSPHCQACTAELPKINALRQHLSSRGFEAVAVAVRWSQAPKAEEVLNVVAPADASGRRSWRFALPVALEDPLVTNAYGRPESLPSAVIIDREGRVLPRINGAHGDHLKHILSDLLR